MKSYTIKISTPEIRKYRSPFELSCFKDHINEIAQGRDDGRAVVEEDDITCAAITALRIFHHCEAILDVTIITCECYCDLDHYVPTIMADCMVTYWMDSKYRIAKLSALSIEACWYGNGTEIHAYIQDFTKSGDRCI